MGGKNPPEAETYVSGEAEDGKGGHGVSDPDFWNPPLGDLANLLTPLSGIF